MSPTNLLRLIALAAIWGGSYAFLHVVAPVYGGIGTMWLRISIAGLAMIAYALITRAELGVARWWRLYLFIGLLNSVIPFTLISFAMKTLPTGYGALLNALSPFFGAIFTVWLLKEKLTALRVIGLACGFAGVAMVVNLGPIAVTPALLVAAFACVLATASYGYASVYLKMHGQGAPNIGIVTYSLVLPALLLAPFVAPMIEWTMPSATVLWSLIGLGVVCSGVAYLLYFRLIAEVGPTKAISVTFLIPVFGLAWGVLFFDERFTLGMAAGTALIFLGMALALGIFKPRVRVK